VTPGTRFPRAARLLLPREFDAVFEGGRRERGRFFVGVHKAGPGPGARLGLAVGKKFLPAARDRNLVKRLAREAFRARRPRLPAVDIVLSPTRDVAQGDRASLRADLDRVLDRIAAGARVPAPTGQTPSP
jgi:ribonuclease P protein component